MGGGDGSGVDVERNGCAERAEWDGHAEQGAVARWVRVCDVHNARRAWADTGRGRWEVGTSTPAGTRVERPAWRRDRTRTRSRGSARRGRAWRRGQGQGRRGAGAGEAGTTLGLVCGRSVTGKRCRNWERSTVALGVENRKHDARAQPLDPRAGYILEVGARGVLEVAAGF
jgi:hypothetical protein